MKARQEDFVFAEHVLRRGYASEEQVEECLNLLSRLREEMQLEETLANLLVKKGYLAPAQAHVIEREIDPSRAGRPRNAIEGYRLIERIGSGAMGSVYKAEHLKLLIPVALKVLRPTLAASPTQIERLRREARLAARLNHPNVVRGLDVGESNGFHFLAMEFVEGVTARQLLDKGPLKEKEALRIVREVARGLEHAHAHGVIHRDVKPGNIMVTRDGTPKLADFGLARGQGPSDLTLEHASIGTPQYVAPEQMRRGADATPRSDLFSLGASLYHLVTGRPPFAGDTLGEIVQNVLACRFEAPEKLVPDLSLDTVYVIHRLMRANPRERYASATELIADLERIDRGERVAPQDFLGDYQAFLRRRRTRRLALLVTTGALLVIAATLVISDQRSKARLRERTARCAALDATGAGPAQQAETVPQLDQLLTSLQAARHKGADCEPGALGELETRVVRVRADRGQLAEAEARRRQAGQPEADYRAIAAALDRLDPGLPGVQKRIAALRAEVTKLSADDAYARYVRQRNRVFATAEEAVAEVKDLATDLERRYLPLDEPWCSEVLRGAPVLEAVHEEWKGLAGYRERFERALAAGNFAHAATELGFLNSREQAARLKLRGPYLSQFLALFPDSEARKTNLAERENDAWNAVQEEVRSDLARGRPDDATEKLGKFSLLATDTLRASVEKLLGEAQQQQQELEEQQLRNYLSDERSFETRARQRLYAAAAGAVARNTRPELLLEKPRAQYDKLALRAERVRELRDRFAERAGAEKELTVKGTRVKGADIRPASGDDPDLFVADGRSPLEFTLNDLERGQLEKVLGLSRTEPADRELRGHFYYLEALRAEDGNRPDVALDFLQKEVLQDLGDSPWAPDVTDHIHRLQALVASGERRAAELAADIEKARAANEHMAALVRCRELLGLQWTKYFEDPAVLPRLKRDIAELERLTKGELGPRYAGVPQTQYVVDVEGDRRVAITYTGKVWYVDEGRVGPNVADPEAWLDQRSRAFWDEFFATQGVDAAGERAKLYERVKHQLWHWSENAENPEDGGYRVNAASRPRRFQDLPGAPLELDSPFRPDAAWSVECDVTFHGDVPGYFALACGQVQAGWGYAGGTARGIAGAALLAGPDLDPQAHAKELGDLHWWMVKEEQPRKRLKDGSVAYLDTFVPGRPYHMKLERTARGEVVFEARPRDSERGAVRLVRRFPARELDRLGLTPDGRRVFRFLHIPPAWDVEPCTLTNVRISGFLEDDRGDR